MTNGSGTIINTGNTCLACQCFTQVTPWGSNDNLCCDITSYSDEALDEARAWATELLSSLTGDQFGFRTFRFMPCTRNCGRCDCGSCGSCCDYGYNKLRLPHFDVCQITKVVYNCVAQDLSTYRVHRDQTMAPYLIAPAEWPTEQRYAGGFTICDEPLTDPVPAIKSWWVEYTHGTPPSIGANQAVGVLACEYLLACDGSDTCRLPDNVISVVRQGVSYTTDPFQYLKEGMVGIATVDRFIKSVNPHRLQRTSTFVSPSSVQSRWVTH